MENVFNWRNKIKQLSLFLGSRMDYSGNNIFEETLETH